MAVYKVIKPTEDNFETLALMSHNVRLFTKAVAKSSTVYEKQKHRVELKYWEDRMDRWLEENTKKVG